MVRERIEAWDFLKTLTIILMVWGHLVQYCVNGEAIDNPLWCWVYSFHMPLFMTLSGMFATLGYNSLSFMGYCKKRFLRILLPCIVWLIIEAVYFMVINDNMSFSTFAWIMKDGFWFLKSVFICGILGYIAMRSSGNLWILITIIISQLIRIWSVPTMYPCFLLGILIYKKLHWFNSNWKAVTSISTVLFLIISIPISLSPSFWKIHSSSLFGAESFYRGMLVMGSRFLTMCTGMLASTALITGSYVLFKSIRKQPDWMHKMTKAGRYTLGVYIIQTVVIETLIAVNFKIPVTTEASYWLVTLLVFTILSVLLTWLCVRITAFVCRNYPVVAMILFGEKMRRKTRMDLKYKIL